MSPTLRKELYLQITPSAISILAVFWLAIGLYFLAAYQEYQTIANQLAQLENRRGATQMLLLPVNQLALWLMALWSCAFGARAVAQEHEWHTAQIAAVQFGTARLIRSKTILQFIALLLIPLPLWFAIIWLWHAASWDCGLLAGILASQLLIAIYASLLAAVLSAACRHSLSAALTAVIIWAALWLLPLLITDPPAANALLQWFSPFAHAGLLTQGQFTLQTGIFLGMHIVFFLTCLQLTDSH